jgi:uncharacterized membrane protein (DUF2068 family)
MRTAALIELAKGVLVLAAGAGLLAFLHRDVQALAEELVGHLHLNPASRAPRIFIDLAGRVSSGDLWLLALGAAIYSLLRLAEGYGLWHGRAWAAWLGIASGLIYVPFEVATLFDGVTPLKLIALTINLAVVAVLADALWQRPRGGAG